MSGYIGSQPVPQATQTRQTFTATSGQTSFATIGYVAGGQFIQVYLNGVLLKLTDDYTAANGSDIVLTSGAATGDILEFISFADFTVNNQNFTGGLTVDNDGSTVLTVDRATSDGTIIDLQKSGSSVGSIGTDPASGDFYVQSQITNHAGLGFKVNEVLPRRNGYVDGIDSLGSSTYRFANLYLSGGVYLGGTGAANKLDDYEEGTFTAYIVDINGSPQSGYSYGSQGGSYTKIGNIVSVRIVLGTNVSVSNGDSVYFNLPFAVSNADMSAYGAVAPLTRFVNFGTDQYPVVEVTRGTSRMAFMKCTSNNTTTLMTNNDLGTTMNLNVSIVYQTA
jgi:hypothetical protein